MSWPQARHPQRAVGMEGAVWCVLVRQVSPGQSPVPPLEPGQRRGHREAGRGQLTMIIVFARKCSGVDRALPPRTQSHVAATPGPG